MEFSKAKRREACPVCQLPDEVREQMRSSRDKKITQQMIKEWLMTDYKKDIKLESLASHNAGHHDDR